MKRDAKPFGLFRLAFLAVVPLCGWKLFFERIYWEYPPINEDPAEVAHFQAMVDAFMRDDFKPLSEEQIDAYFRDGWITIDAYIPKPIAAVMAKYNDYFRNYTWHYNTYEDYSTKGYMGYLESEVYRYFDKHGPLKHLNKQLLDRYYNESLPGVRLWNELVISTNSDVNGIRIHYDRGSYSHLADEEMGSSSWIMLADFDTRQYGKGLAMVNMTAVPDYCLEDGAEGQNYFPKGVECISKTHNNTHAALVGQGALVLFNRWTYHRTASKGPVPVPKGLERAVHVTRWVHPNARASLMPSEGDKTGGSRAGNKCAALGLGARNYFCRSHPNRQEKPAWKSYVFDMLHGSADLEAAGSFPMRNCVPDVFREEMPTYNDVSISFTRWDIARDFPQYYFGELFKNWKTYSKHDVVDKSWDHVDLDEKLEAKGVIDNGQSAAGINPNLWTGADGTSSTST